MANLKKVQTVELVITKEELVHLRDLFSILLPPDGKFTISRSLAYNESRPFIEGTLWTKIHDLCLENDIPVDGEAPDFFLALEQDVRAQVLQLNAHAGGPPDDPSMDYTQENDEDFDQEMFNEENINIEEDTVKKKTKKNKKKKVKNKEQD